MKHTTAKLANKMLVIIAESALIPSWELAMTLASLSRYSTFRISQPYLRRNLHLRPGKAPG
jgi:hypothetical protein